MTREEAIKILKIKQECSDYEGFSCGIEMNEYKDGCNVCIEAIDMAIEALKEPKVGGWIPVSERLPEEPNYYEVTVDFGSKQITEVVFYSICESRWGAYINDITAWRERLQEPYKAGEQE